MITKMKKVILFMPDISHEVDEDLTSLGQLGVVHIAPFQPAQDESIDRVGARIIQMQTAMDGLGLSMEMTAGTWVMSVLMSLLTGLVVVFLYAAARPRFGPGPKTAILVGVALFLGGMFLSLMGYGMMGLFPTRLLLIWGCIGAVEMVLVSLAGAWVYRE